MTQTTKLQMTGCNDAEFTCSNAFCVNMSARCDGKMDCEDRSDEAECEALVMPIGYNKFLVPPLNANSKTLILNFTLDIQGLIEVNEMKQYVQTKISYYLTWFDSHLTYNNLKEHENNKMFPSYHNQIWRPYITFENIANKKKVVGTDVLQEIRIIPSRNFSFRVADSTYLHNTHIFEGSHTALEERKQFTVEWICNFNMEWYPFDRQNCALMFRNEFSSIKLVPSVLTYSGTKNLPQHYVQDVKICSAIIAGDNGVIVEVILGRPLFSSFLTTTLPTGMLVVISQMATAFSMDYLDMVLQVNLTVFLVLATL